MKKMNWYFSELAAMVVAGLVFSCSIEDRPLPILGQRYFDGKDTVYHVIAPFSLVNQDSQIVNRSTVTGKIYVADFFFTSCRTICPKMKTQMKRVYDATAGMDDFLILSHTIDPDYDNVSRLHEFAGSLQADSKRWHFLTGVRDTIFNLAQTSYFATAMADAAEPDGYIHSGAFLLIDRKGRIRGKYDGTLPEEADRLVGDIKKLRASE